MTADPDGDGVEQRTRLAGRGPLSPLEAVRTLRPVASALAAAHRDGRKELTLNADISAFGALLLEALLGRPPAPHEIEAVRADPDRVATQLATGGATGNRVSHIIARAVAEDPADRFGSADELVLTLEAARAAARAAPLAPGQPRDRQPQPQQSGQAGQDAPAAPADDRPQRTVGARMRTPQLAAAAAASVLAVVLIVALATYDRTSGTPRGQARQASVIVPARTTAVHPRPTPVHTTPVTPGRLTPTPAAPIGPAATVVAGHLSVARTIDLGAATAGLSVTPTGVVWVSVPSRDELVEIGANRSRTTWRGITAPGAIAAASAGVWVTDPTANAVALFTGGRLRGRRVLTAPPIAIALDPADGSAWVADRSGGLTHLGTVHISSAHVAPPPTAIAIGEPNWVWSADGSLVQTSPTSGQSRTFPAGRGAVAVALNQGVWTAHANGAVTRFDPRPGHRRLTATVTAPAPLTGIAAREQSPFVWAISESARALYEIAVAHPRIVGAVRFASPPTGVAVTHLGVWVTTADGSLIRIQR